MAEGFELQAVITNQAVIGANPHESMAVLQQPANFCGREPVPGENPAEIQGFCKRVGRQNTKIDEREKQKNRKRDSCAMLVPRDCCKSLDWSGHDRNKNRFLPPSGGKMGTGQKSTLNLPAFFAPDKPAVGGGGTIHRLLKSFEFERMIRAKPRWIQTIAGVSSADPGSPPEEVPAQYLCESGRLVHECHFERKQRIRFW